ncbi:hypothetical protein RHMOL_Rhmol02G0146900 [Rhododendron molle]|uniref:Uncharacterized protein n=1 Tax=Rhododendron molle TaxID=49168 RepID=A0ACC0PSV7_RHOML|nr:hypothetical protein RHMOL_Rhmol02G0146900 [Rhododendron molle]
MPSCRLSFSPQRNYIGALSLSHLLRTLGFLFLSSPTLPIVYTLHHKLHSNNHYGYTYTTVLRRTRHERRRPPPPTTRQVNTMTTPPPTTLLSAPSLSNHRPQSRRHHARPHNRRRRRQPSPNHAPRPHPTPRHLQPHIRPALGPNLRPAPRCKDTQAAVPVMEPGRQLHDFLALALRRSRSEPRSSTAYCSMSSKNDTTSLSSPDQTHSHSRRFPPVLNPPIGSQPSIVTLLGIALSLREHLDTPNGTHVVVISLVHFYHTLVWLCKIVISALVFGPIIFIEDLGYPFLSGYHEPSKTIGLLAKGLPGEGRLLARAGDYTATADIYEKVLELCPDDWECFLHYLGCSHLGSILLICCFCVSFSEISMSGVVELLLAYFSQKKKRLSSTRIVQEGHIFDALNPVKRCIWSQMMSMPALPHVEALWPGLNTVIREIVFMVTNQIDILDQALPRPRRIDRKIEFSNANEEVYSAVWHDSLSIQEDSYGFSRS